MEAEALVKRYGDRAAVKEASFTIRRGEIFALLGPNGAGKTTTVEMLEGFRRPDAGRVRVLGRDPWSERRHLAPRVGVMPQEGALHAGIKPREAVRLFAAFYPNPADPAKLLEDVGLGPVASTPYRRLSGGEKQRLSLALALAGSPRVLFLDEPTAHMDPRGRADTWELIGSYRDRGTTVLLTTHLLDEAERLADRVAVIHHGEIVAVDTPQRVAASKDGDQVRFRVASPINPGALGDVLGAPVELVTGGEYVVRAVGDTPSFVARLTAFLASHDVSLWELRVGGRSLEEAFLELTAERGEER